MITRAEHDLARHCVKFALDNGASAIRVSLNKNVTDSYNLLNGELDKVSHSADRSIFIYLYAQDRYGTFSTNRLEKDELENLISRAITMVGMLGEDKCRTLPDPTRTAKDAVIGTELELFDTSYLQTDSETRLNRAMSMSNLSTFTKSELYEVISEECEYAESCDESLLIDSQGFEGRHKETSFNCFAEITIQDNEGNKYSGHWWDAAPLSLSINLNECSRIAFERAVRQIGPHKRRSGRYKIVVDTSVSSRLISPILNALNSASIQQKMSFLEDSEGKKVFCDGMTLMDMARVPGKSGARLFDSEGVATKNAPIIENGTIKQYFTNTYISNKTGYKATVEDISRPCILPYIKGSSLANEEKDVSLKDILTLCGNGIYITGFNGGNSNPVTGDFSFGIEGFAFSKGKITHPVKEMLITGNLIQLWNSLVAAGSDARESARWQIPTLAFENVSFSS